MSSHLARLEALLFVAGEDGLSLRTIAQLLDCLLYTSPSPRD